MPQVSTTGTVSDFEGWTPWLYRRKAGSGIPVRITCLWRVPSLHSVYCASAMMPLALAAASMMLEMFPSGSVRDRMSARDGFRSESSAIGHFSLAGLCPVESVGELLLAAGATRPKHVTRLQRFARAHEELQEVRVIAQ